jgi:hypothetical protein
VAAEGEQREAMRSSDGGTRTRSRWIEAAPSATAPCPGFRSNRHDDRLGVVVDADAFDSGARQPHERWKCLLFCTLFCASWFRVLGQRETMEQTGCKGVNPLKTTHG